MNSEKIINETRRAFLLNGSLGFFSRFLVELPLQIEEFDGIAKTDGKRIAVTKDWLTLSLDYRLFILAHEVLHVSLKHHLRRGERDAEKWNIAADYAINPLLAELPQGQIIIKELGLLYDQRFDGQSAEQIYSRLNEPNEKEKQTARSGGVEDMPGSKQEYDIEENKITATGKQAQTYDERRQAGKGSTKIKGALAKAYAKPVDWRNVLDEYLDQYTQGDWSFRKPSRRSIDDSIFLPSIEQEKQGYLLVMLDVSGSMSNKAVAECLDQCRQILASGRVQRATLAQFDDRILSQVELDGFNLSQIKREGTGGTILQPCLDALELDETPSVCVVLTDGGLSEVFDLGGGVQTIKAEFPLLFCLTESTFEDDFKNVDWIPIY